MKTNSSLRRFALFSSFVLTASLHALEVHEWGTFTVLVSSDGRTVNWYQPYSDIAQFPTFTYNALTMKSSIGLASVRMETPVIYFYPEEEMAVQAKVMFRGGQITERFPAATDKPYQRKGMISVDNNLLTICSVPRKTIDDLFEEKMLEIGNQSWPTVTYWSGKLLPPSHADAKLIPSVAGHKGENYGAAREVPDAWIFRADSPMIKNANQPDIHPVEKFIFYRGVGQNVPPYSVAMSNEQTMSFSNYSSSASRFQVALRVRDGKASWKQLPTLPEPKEQTDRSTSVTFPEQTISIEQADKELSALFLTELTKSGLTKDEAKAMIKTWNHTWFSEPGQRVFTIVDRTWVDSTLPLAISPEPKKIERVFVARYEVLSPETKEKLATLMRDEKPGDQAASDFKALNLGRFANGAAQLVSDEAKQKAISNYSRLLSKSVETKEP